jgi:hypothetical protein
MKKYKDWLLFGIQKFIKLLSLIVDVFLDSQNKWVKFSFFEQYRYNEYSLFFF